MSRTAIVGVALMAALVLAAPATPAAESDLAADMTSAAVVPQPGPPAATGRADITIDDVSNDLCYILTFSGIDEPTEAHVHEGEAGVAGDVAVDLRFLTNGDQGCVRGKPAVLAAIADEPEAYYVDVHTENYPDGAIRGQLADA